MTFFENITFYLNNSIIMLFRLNSLFYLIIPYNIFYFKFNLRDLEKISRFILKTYSLH
jgi:hypothetical protein